VTAYPELCWPDEQHVGIYVSDFRDNVLTHLEICVECGGDCRTCVHISNGSQPEEEIDMDDVVIIEDSDGVPTYINPNEEPTKPMPWASTPPRYATSTWEDITVVEKVQRINTSEV
jgi:hypothetical protein